MGRKSKPLQSRYGKWEVIGLDHKKGALQYYKCRCECGTEKVILKSNLTTGKSTSCGCSRRKENKKTDSPIVLVDEFVSAVQQKIASEKPQRPEVTEENYFTTEINMAYLDCTTYKNFVGTPGIKPCEARALAEAKGEIEHPVSIPLMVGSYVDAYFSGELDKFKSEYPEIFSTRGATAGELKSDYKQADVMIQRAIKEPLFMQFMKGDTQTIFTGEIEGVPVRVKVDSIDGKRITDLKTVKSLKRKNKDSIFVNEMGERLNFIEQWDYFAQAAMYREIVRQNIGETLPFYIAAISKDKTDNIPHPRLAIIQIPEPYMDDKLVEIKTHINDVWDIMQGNIDPVFCYDCDFCADTLPLDHISTPDEF